MTPDERRKRAEYVIRMAEQGILAEPSYDREVSRAQKAGGELASPDTRAACSDGPDGATQESRRTA